MTARVEEDGISCCHHGWKFDTEGHGLEQHRSISHRDDGKVFYRVTEAALATLRVVPNPRVAQFAHVDDISFRIYVAGRVKNSGDDTNEASRRKHGRSC